MSESVVPQETAWELERISSGYLLWCRIQADCDEKGLSLLQSVKEATGWSQTMMASRVGCTKHHMSRVFRGREKVSASLITRMQNVIRSEQGLRDREDTTVKGTGAGVPGAGDRLEDLEEPGGGEGLE